ncbi:hypothetical protein SASPL_107352 [Salvia splendens]|uniref:Uncharacterized protein n=1 Tax=Salvia splendens TaxID=180675 RepID=A0A8X8YGN3_SALSN|nr:hypothetical protein SASPL_107352 [Salvia splendens]
MSSAMKKMNAINHIVRLRQVMRSWKNKSLYEPADLNPEPHPVQWRSMSGGRATASWGIVLSCDAGFFGCIMELLQKDEKKLHSLELHEFVQMVSEARFQCKQVGSKSIRGHSINLESRMTRMNQSCKRYYSSPPPNSIKRY